VSLEAGGGIPCRPNPAATLLVRECFRRFKARCKPLYGATRGPLARRIKNDAVSHKQKLERIT